MTFEVSHLVEQSVHPSIGARSIVAEDVDDECVIQLTKILDRLNQLTGLMVGELAVTSKDFHLMGEEFLLVGRKLVPILDQGRTACPA